MTVVTGAALAISQLHDHAEHDDAELTDQVTEDLLHMFGVPAASLCQPSATSLTDVDDSWWPVVVTVV